MRVALVIESMDPRRGGRETSTAQIAQALARRGHEVTVICEQGGWNAPGVTIRALGPRGRLRAGRLRGFLEAAAKEAVSRQYDVVHAMLPLPAADVYQPRGGTVPGQIAGSGRRWKQLGWLRTSLFERLNVTRGLLGRLEAIVAADPRVWCLAVSRMVAEEFARYYGRREGVRVVYNGVDVPRVDPAQWADWRQRVRYTLGVGQDAPVFLSVATNFPLKGVAETIRAFARWMDRRHRQINARLVVVGRELVEGYQRLAGLNGVGRQVVFVPPTPEIHQWYAAADACILLSWYDPCSRTVLEAVSAGLPSITTIYNGAAEILAEGAGIVLASPDDSGAAVSAFEELSDPAKRRLRREACEKAAAAVTMDRHVEQLLEVYREAARQR